MEVSGSSQSSGKKPLPVSSHTPPAAGKMRQTLSPPRHKRLGQVLKGRYRIDSLIASGGMSDVYRATDLRLEQAGVSQCQVAVKILRSVMTRDPGALRLLAREASQSMGLCHPNIIRVQDLDHDPEQDRPEGTWFMVMELLEGEPLSRVIQRAKPQGLSWPGSREVLGQVLQALAYSHRQSIVHADLKPSNIYVTDGGDIKLLDFGVAQALKPLQHLDFLQPRQEDETTVYGYTPAYASPAILAGEEPGVADDLYALACISYELLSSRHPFQRRNLSDTERARYPLQRPRAMPRRLWRLVQRLLRGQGQKVTLADFQQALTPPPWQRRIYPAALTASLALATSLGFQLHSEQQQARQSRDSARIQAANLTWALGLAPQQLLEALPTQDPVQRSALLRERQDALVDHYLHRMERRRQASTQGNLPDLPGAIKLLEEALDYYPHDRRLLEQGETVQRQNQSLQSALAEEIRNRLLQGDYDNAEGMAALEALAEDFRFLSDRPLPVPEQALSIFEEQLQAAMEKYDGPALARLLRIARQFLQEQSLEETAPSLAARLTRARELEEAISLLGDYHEALADGGNKPTYPRDAAETFYARRLQQWRETIDSAQGSRPLDLVYEEMQNSAIPAQFPPLRQLRQSLANAYLAQAESLLDNNRARQAQPLLQKATTLMRHDSGEE